MSDRNYKVGDIVKILKWEDLPDNKESKFPYYLEEMKDYCGKLGKIIRVDFNEEQEIAIYGIVFEFENYKENYYTFADWMFEKDADIDEAKNELKEITINLEKFSNLESLSDYISEKYSNYFDKKVARKEFLKLNPTEEEIQLLRILNEVSSGSLFYGHDECCVLINNNLYPVKMFDRFYYIMNYLENTDNVFLPISLLLGEEKEKND